nr:MAG: hypothetical protein [Bacteriophage sp.]UWH98642.1 MAG: hypothetical protein [Bacteriophage sp.]
MVTTNADGDGVPVLVKFIVLTGLSSQYEADGSTPEVISCQSELTILLALFPESM